MEPDQEAEPSTVGKIEIEAGADEGEKGRRGLAASPPVAVSLGLGTGLPCGWRRTPVAMGVSSGHRAEQEASVGRLDEATGGAEGERRTGRGKACLALDLIVSQGWL